MRDVHVFGDSHWRVFFPFVNHGSPGVTFEHCGIRMIDMVANELSGATMYGLLNDGSKNGARRRILGDLDRIGPVENVALVFGEVDARYHNSRYFVNGKFSPGRAYDLLARYRRFIDEDLLFSGRVRNRVFVYSGYCYPKYEHTLLQPGVPIGDAVKQANLLNNWISDRMSEVVESTAICHISILPRYQDVSEDGVHLLPLSVFPEVVTKIIEEFER